MQKKEKSNTLAIFWMWAQFLWDYCWNSPYLRFLNIGFVNIAFLLAIGVILDYYLRNFLPTFLIALLVSIFHVSFSFVSRKIFIYKTKGNWLKEYLRCFLLYGGSILLYSLLLWLFVDGLHMYFFIAQIVALLSGKIYYSIASYFYFMPKTNFLPDEQLESFKTSVHKEKMLSQSNLIQNTANYSKKPDTIDTPHTTESLHAIKSPQTQEDRSKDKKRLHFGFLDFITTQKKEFFKAFEEFKVKKQKFKKHKKI